MKYKDKSDAAVGDKVQIDGATVGAITMIDDEHDCAVVKGKYSYVSLHSQKEFSERLDLVSRAGEKEAVAKEPTESEKAKAWDSLSASLSCQPAEFAQLVANYVFGIQDIFVRGSRRNFGFHGRSKPKLEASTKLGSPTFKFYFVAKTGRRSCRRFYFEEFGKTWFGSKEASK